MDESQPIARTPSKSNRKTAHSKIFFGWWTVWITGILSGFGHSFYGLGISVFFKDLAAELGISRAITSLAAGIGRLEGGVTSPLTGWLSDRFGPKWIIFTGICIAGTGMILMNFINSVMTYMIVWGLIIGVGLNIGLTVAVDKALNDWFIAKRGLAQGTKFALIGVGSIIVLPIVTFLVTQFGWRTTCLIWGCFMLTCSPLALVFVRQKRPEFYGLLPDGIKPAFTGENQSAVNDDESPNPDSDLFEPEFSFKQAIKTKAYWILAIGFGVQMLIMGGINIHLIPYLTDSGIDRVTAGGMMSFMVFFTIPSRFFSGVAADRVGKNRLNFLLAGGFLIQTIALTILLLGHDLWAVYVFLALYGFASGAGTPLFILNFGRYFGRKAFGTIFGSSIAVRAPVALIAPVFSGWIFDVTGSYNIAFTVFTVFAAVTALLMCIVRPEILPASLK